MRDRSMQTPPCSASTCPSSDVPAPNGTIGHFAAGADANDRADFVGRYRERDEVGSRRRVIRLAVAMMVADRRGRGHALAEQLAQRFEELVGSGSHP